MTGKTDKYTWVVCELSGYKKGYITIHFDFTSNILSWKDSNHWYNNFVRGLPKHQIDPVKEILFDFIETNKAESIEKPDTPKEYVWTIQAGKAEDKIEIKGYDITTEDWRKVTLAIEKIARREFKL